MILISKITMPVVDFDIEVGQFMKELKNKLKWAKEDNDHFDWKCVRFTLTKDNEGTVWLTGFTKKDGNE